VWFAAGKCCNATVYPQSVQGYNYHGCKAGPGAIHKRGVTGMNTRERFLATLVAVLTLVPAVALAGPGRGWTGTGTITNVNGPTLFLLCRDNIIYKIDVRNSQVIFNQFDTDCCRLRIGDTARVYGIVTGPKTINAKRVRVLERKNDPQTSRPEDVAVEKVVKIVIDNEPVESEGKGAGPATSKAPDWDARGLVTDIDYTARRIKMQTPRGNITVDINGAVLAAGKARIGLGNLNLGDSIRVVG